MYSLLIVKFFVYRTPWESSWTQNILIFMPRGHGGPKLYPRVHSLVNWSRMEANIQIWRLIYRSCSKKNRPNQVDTCCIHWNTYGNHWYMITTYCVYVDEKWFRPKTKCSNSLKILNYSDYDRLKKIGSAGQTTWNLSRKRPGFLKDCAGY